MTMKNQYFPGTVELKKKAKSAESANTHVNKIEQKIILVWLTILFVGKLKLCMWYKKLTCTYLIYTVVKIRSDRIEDGHNGSNLTCMSHFFSTMNQLVGRVTCIQYFLCKQIVLIILKYL
jgi:hypothetical protein